MQLHEALQQVAAEYGLDAEQLIGFAADDTVGGYHEDRAQARWEIGSIWGVEGQVVYALVRATKPKMIVNLGTFQGCSTAHILAAIRAAQADDPKYKPTLTAIDFYQPSGGVPNGVKFLQMDAHEYVEQHMPSGKVDFLFEDLYHGSESVKRVWSAFKEKAKKDALIISHDGEHYIVGVDVRMGILASGIPDFVRLAIEPANCGLAVWRKP